MYQVGDQASFALAPTPNTGTQIYSYVFRFWDGTVLATINPFTLPVTINIGGQPGTGELHYSVTPVQIDGQSTVIAGTITANNPPTIAPSPTISVNDGYFPYQTELSVVAFDMDGDAFSFGWYVDDVLINSGTFTYIGNVPGTWAGNGTVIVADYAGTQNVFDLTVNAETTVTCVITDANSGITTLDFQMRGSTTSPPQIGVSGAISGLTADASDLPEQRIGVGQFITFSVYGRDLSGGPVSFLWNFAGSNNWTVALETTGTVSALPDGGFQSVYQKDISGEIVSFGTEKVAIAVATISGLTSQTVVQQPVTLIANSPPQTVDFVVKNNGTVINAGGNEGGGDSFPAGTQLEFDAVAIDPNGDLVEYHWQFQQPIGVLPTTLDLWGAKVVVGTTTYPSGSLVQGVLIATDRMGAVLVVDAPFVSIV